MLITTQIIVTIFFFFLLNIYLYWKTFSYIAGFRYSPVDFLLFIHKETYRVHFYTNNTSSITAMLTSLIKIKSRINKGKEKRLHGVYLYCIFMKHTIEFIHDLSKIPIFLCLLLMKITICVYYLDQELLLGYNNQRHIVCSCMPNHPM